jgi:LacI family transcriptional regulator
MKPISETTAIDDQMDRRDAGPLLLRDVAQRAGVSPATVSRVLNNNPRVGHAKRLQVLQAIDELGYRRNRVASNLRRQRVQMIGIVMSDIENPHFTQMVRAAEDAAYQRGYRVIVCNSDEDPVKQQSYLEMLAAERVAGAIVTPTEAGAREISDLIDLGTSVVAFDRVVDDPRADAVLVNNLSGSRLATAHLIEGGHTRIGFVGGLPSVQTGAERLAGYVETMRDAGLECHVAEGDFRVEGGRRATAELLGHDTTALVVANNLMAVGALRAINESGRRVSRDVALIGVDDPPWAELTDPPLTTLAQPVREMADRAVQLLLERLDGRTTPKRCMFEFELRHRQSCCS